MDFTRDFSAADKQKLLSLRTEMTGRADGVAWTDADLHKLNDLLIYASRIMLDSIQIDAKARETQLNIKPNDQSRQTQITFNDATFIRSEYFDITGDNSAIVYSRRREADSHNEIWIMNMDGTDNRKVPHPRLDSNYPTYNPQADKIVFGGDPDVAHSGILARDYSPFMINSDGTGIVDIAGLVPAKDKYGFGENFKWSPDGQWILCFSERGQGDGKSCIYKFKVDGSQEVKLTAWEVNGTCYYPSWNPDGTKILYDAPTAGNKHEVWIMNADGTGKTQLTNNVSIESGSSMHPYQEKIAYSSNATGQWQIYTMNSDGTDIKVLTEGIALSRYPQYTSDGTRILFANNRTGNAVAIWSMPSEGVPVNPEFRHEFLMATQDTYHAAWAYDHAESYRIYADNNIADQSVIQMGREQWSTREDDPAIVDRSLLRHGYRDKREGEADPEDILGRYAYRYQGVVSKYPNEALYPSDTLYPSD